MELEKLQYPIGRFNAVSEYNENQCKIYIDEIDSFPTELKETVKNLSVEQLNTPYREGGWKVKQVIHHVCDSHLNGYIRFKWAVTEENTLIKTYNEKLWAETPDALDNDLALSFNLLSSVHKKLVNILSSLTKQQLMLSYNNPESGSIFLYQAIQLYAWHGKHHLAHINKLKIRMGWK